jgi:hypothetical protein
VQADKQLISQSPGLQHGSSVTMVEKVEAAVNPDAAF